jgi:hypothetical protein
MKKRHISLFVCLLCLLALLVAVSATDVTMAQASLRFQETTTPVLTPTPNLTTSTPIAQSPEDFSKDWWAVLLDKIALLLWPIVVLALVWRFRKPISILLERVASTVQTLEIGNVKLGLPYVTEAIVEREILKIGIMIATIDNDPDPDELRFLERITTGMAVELDKLAVQDKVRILREGVNMAASDGVIKNEEYVALILRATKFDMVSELDDMVIEKCLLPLRKGRYPTPPPQLEHRYQRRLEELGQQKL